MRLWQEAEEFRLRSIALKIKVTGWICTWHSYITVLKYKSVKPMRKSSKSEVTFGHDEWNEWWPDRERRMVWSSYEAADGMDFRGRSEIIFQESRRRREPNPLPIRSVCLYMRKWTICQFEWHRDNKILLPSQRATGNVVFWRRFFDIHFTTHSFSQTRCRRSA